jgi:Tfp pilus assembly protein PilN
LARTFETVANAAPPAVVLRSLRAARDGRQWTISVSALADGADETAARNAADRFLRALSVLGAPLQPATIRFLPEAGGVELAATYRVPS